MKTVDARTRTAFHEAGHAALSAAIANPPEHVTIKAEGHTLGRSGARMSSRPTTRVQVHLAGFAAEHLLTGRRPGQLGQEIGFSLLARLDPALGEAYAGSEARDGHRAVEELLRVGTYEDDDAVSREVDRYYEIARESLSVVWPAVKAIAKALLRDGEMDRRGFDGALGDVDLCTPIIAIQRAHGLLPERSPSERQPAKVSSTSANTGPTAWNRPSGVPEEMTEQDFQAVVEVFRVLKTWRDEERAKRCRVEKPKTGASAAGVSAASRGSAQCASSITIPSHVR